MLGQYGCVLHVNLRLVSSSNNRPLTSEITFCRLSVSAARWRMNADRCG